AFPGRRGAWGEAVEPRVVPSGDRGTPRGARGILTLDAGPGPADLRDRPGRLRCERPAQARAAVEGPHRRPDRRVADRPAPHPLPVRVRFPARSRLAAGLPGRFSWRGDRPVATPRGSG